MTTNRWPVFLIGVLLTLSLSNVLAADGTLDPSEKSISEFVSPDGRIDLDAVRNSGYQGPLDLKGVDVRIDPKTGEPLVQVASASSADPDDVYWDNTISPSILLGVNGEVFALTVYDSNLIVGGYFSSAGDVATNKIASWNGSSWAALGTGMSGTFSPSGVRALTVYENKLIAGGEFTTAGGVPAINIASWDGNSWSALHSGMNGSVYALAVYENKLIVGGGWFDVVAGIAANNIAS